MDQPYILIITGHSCSGKSTLIKVLQEKLPGSYHIGYDKIKWGLSGYNRLKHVETIRSLLFGFIEVIFKQGLPCIIDIFFHDKEKYDQLLHLSQQYGHIRK